MAVLEVVFLGTTGPFPSGLSDNTALLIEAGNQKILVDCPGGIVHKLIQAGCDPRRIDGLFLTHVHIDHVYGLPSLVHSLMLYENIIKVYGSRTSVLTASSLLEFFDLKNKKYRTRIEFVTVEPESQLFFPAFEVSAFKMPHHESSLAYSFNSSFNRQRLVVSGDTPACAEFFKWAEGSTALVHDCSAPERFFHLYPVMRSGHTSARDLGRYSQQAEVQTLVPCHFLADLDFELFEIESEIKENFTGHLFIPRYLDRLTVK